jgi:hypothetical protein
MASQGGALPTRLCLLGLMMGLPIRFLGLLHVCCGLALGNHSIGGTAGEIQAAGRSENAGRSIIAGSSKVNILSNIPGLILVLCGPFDSLSPLGHPHLPTILLQPA